MEIEGLPIGKPKVLILFIGIEIEGPPLGEVIGDVGPDEFCWALLRTEKRGMVLREFAVRRWTIERNSLESFRWGVK